MDTASFLVTGGCGLQGSYIVMTLLERYPRARVAVMARSPTENRFPGATYLAGDITSTEDIARVFNEVKPTVVFHCAAVMTAARRRIPDEVVRKINLTGTEQLLDACRAAQDPPVRAFVFTSSASVVQREAGGFQWIVNGDETLPTVREEDGVMAYPTTKAAAERLVLTADDPKGGLRTAALRPAMIYGERDNDMTPGFMGAWRIGRNKNQIGPNTNRVSTTYVGNSTDAHLLAAEKLLSDKPDGVAGEAFFVTNDDDLTLWDFARSFSRAAGTPIKPEEIRMVNPRVALWVAWAVEWYSWLRGTQPVMTQQMVKYTQIVRYYNISKAKERLGYKPQVGWEEGVRRAVKDYLEKEGLEYGKQPGVPTS